MFKKRARMRRTNNKEIKNKAFGADTNVKKDNSMIAMRRHNDEENNL